ncbi:MAG TPA: amidohydrolase family protein [Vicinamibacterales bacterium]|nr:amidohydrolase family protein [Vicinamibacterales bacterium]
MSTFFRARWLLPIERSPIDGGWIEVAGGRIVRIGGGRPPATAADLGDVALLPGLVNAHTHVELSWLQGRIPPAASMHEWISEIVRIRRAGTPGGRDTEVAAARRGVASMVATGTAVVGDISNSLITPELFREAGLSGVVFHELLGFNAPDPVGAVRDAWARVDEIRRNLEEPLGTAGNPWEPYLSFSVVAHAPYSVSPALFTAIAARAGRAPLSIHLGESPEEVEFLRTGLGPIRRTLEALGVWTDAWRVPNCDPVQYVTDLGYLQPGTLVVHAVHLTDDGLERLRRARAVIVTCPRSNLWVGAGPPRLAHFYAARVPVAVGTDSLASSPTLSLFDELAEMRRLAPEVSAALLLESATRVGADALGCGRDYGTLAPGKRAVFAQVAIPASVADVEEYLVSGVPAAAIAPLRP